MSKPFRIILVIVVLVIIAWFIPIVPTISWKISGVPGCHTLATRTLKSIILPDQSNIIPIARTAEVEKPIAIASWGECGIN